MRWHSFGFGLYRASDSHVLIAPRIQNPNARAVLFCPSHGNISTQAITPGWFEHVVSALAEAGFPVFAGDMGGGTAWGNDTMQSALSSARTYAGSRYGLRNDKVILLGTSMGVLGALNWARANPTLTACVLGAVPVVDLADIHDNNRSSYAAEIETAYGGAGSYATAASAHNPAAHASDYADIPIGLWYSSSDPTAIPGTVTAFASGSGAQTTSLGAVGHNPLSTNAAEVVSFATAHA